MPDSVQQIASDPQFWQFTPEQRTTIMGKADPDFLKLGPADQIRAMETMRQKFGKPDLANVRGALYQQNARNAAANLGGSPMAAGAQTFAQGINRVPGQILGAQLDQVKATAQTALQPILHPIDTSIPGMGYQGVKGALEHMDNPQSATGALGNIGVDIPGARQAYQQGNIPSAAQKILNPALQAILMKGAGEAVPAIREAIPSKAGAIENFEAVAKEANPIPLNTEGVQPIVERVVNQLGKRGFRQLPYAIQDWYKRVTPSKKNPAPEPLTYEEGRDFYKSATGKLSAEESQKLRPEMKFQLGLFTNALKQSLSDAAAQVGKRPEFEQALSEYHRAMTMERVGTTALKWALPGGLVGAEGYRLYKELSK